MKKMIVSFALGALLLATVWFLVSYWKGCRGTSFKPGVIKHLGIMMDGNRRWARKTGLAPWLGHRKGVDPLKMTVKFCLEHKIPYLTLYTFSLENFKRSQEELDYLFNVLAKEIASTEFDALFKQGVKVVFVGNRTLFPLQLIPIIRDVEEKTKNNQKLTLTLLFCYGGQQEIIAASQKLAAEVQMGKLLPENITKDLFEEYLWTGTMPPPDLIIRTGNRHCMSNFLSFQAAYSELYFSDLYWPEFTEKDLRKALECYCQCVRNFGK